MGKALKNLSIPLHLQTRRLFKAPAWPLEAMLGFNGFAKTYLLS